MESIQGPADPRFAQGLRDGLSVVSRIGEVVLNVKPDPYAYGKLKNTITVEQLEPQLRDGGGNKIDTKDTRTPAQLRAAYETKPHYHDFSSALPGMICVSEKRRSAAMHVGYPLDRSEAVTPVITCSSCLLPEDEKKYYFVGIVRSKHIAQIDDGCGSAVDDHYTASAGGLATLVNNSNMPIYPGDELSWTFWCPPTRKYALGPRNDSYPRRVAVCKAVDGSEQTIGRAITFAKPGERFDMLIAAT
jgi:hypothetical protein